MVIRVNNINMFRVLLQNFSHIVFYLALQDNVSIHSAFLLN